MVILGAFSIFGVTDPGLAAVPLIVIIIITIIKDGLKVKELLLDAKSVTILQLIFYMVLRIIMFLMKTYLRGEDSKNVPRLTSRSYKFYIRLNQKR